MHHYFIRVKWQNCFGKKNENQLCHCASRAFPRPSRRSCKMAAVSFLPHSHNPPNKDTQKLDIECWYRAYRCAELIIQNRIRTSNSSPQNSSLSLSAQIRKFPDGQTKPAHVRTGIRSLSNVTIRQQSFARFHKIIKDVMQMEISFICFLCCLAFVTCLRDDLP